jgi:flagellar assembly protein FliH
MQSSYKVIKNNSVNNSGLRQIVTSSETLPLSVESENNAKNNIESYEALARTILENARKQAEQIIIKAYEETRFIEEEALAKAEQLKAEAYENAFRLGNEEGYNKAYFETIEQARAEGEGIVASALELLNNAKAEYEAYFEKKSSEINELILSIAANVLKKEVQDKSAINEMIFEALEMSKKAKNFIIRCNGLYVEELKGQANRWKEELGFSGDIFIVKDDTLEPGNAIIDKGNGKVVVGIDYALQRVLEILEGKD